MIGTLSKQFHERFLYNYFTERMKDDVSRRLRYYKHPQLLKESAEIRTSKQKKQKRKISQKTCRYCNKKFRLQIQLNFHLSKEHAAMGFRCIKCTKSFHGLSRYADHVTYIHHDPAFSDPRKHQCNFCKARFYMAESLKTHFNLCLKTSAKCHFCDYEFGNQMSLKTHIFQTHMDLRFTDSRCPWCMKQVTADHITYHILSSHTDATAPVTTNRYHSNNSE